MTQAKDAPSDFFHKLSKPIQHSIALAILFIVPLILFFDITLGGKELQRHDITQFRAGAESIIDYREKFGEEPLWASNMFGGMPSFVISTKTQVPHLEFLSRPFKSLYPAFQFWVLLSGMYFFLILMRFRPLSAAFGSMMFGLSTYFTVIIIAGHTSKFFTIALIPWILCGYWLLTRSKHKVAGLLLFTAAMALEVRATHPQITYYFLYLLGFLWLFDGWKAFKEKKIKKWAIITLLLFTGGVMGVLGNAERTLSQQEYAKHSTRGGSAISETTGLDTNYAFLWSQGISETLSLIVPDIYGGASPDYWGPKSVTSGPHYFGALLLPFFIIALFKVRKKIMYVFLGTGIMAIFFSWGGHFLVLNNLAFEYIPLFNKFRAPETWLVLTSFCFTVVAVYGLDWIFDFKEKKNTAFKELYAPLGLTAMVFLGSFLFVNSLSFTKANEIDSIASQIAQQNQVSPQNPQVQQQALNYVNTRLVPEREEKAKGDVIRLGLFILLSGGVIYLFSTSKLSPALAGFGFIFLLGADMIPVDQRYMPEQSFVDSVVDAEKIILSNKRDIDQYIQENINSADGYPYRVFPLLDNPFSNAEPSYFYPSLGGYSGAKLSLAQDVFMANKNPLFAGATGINLGLLRVLNTKYITYSRGLSFPGIKPVFEGQAGVVYEVENVLPKAFFVDSVITVETAKAAYDKLFPSNLDFANTAIVENFDAVTSPDSTSLVRITDYTGAELEMEVSRSKTGFLVISEIYYADGWVALLNGKEIPIYKTNYLLRGVQIPEGTHTLSLDFRPNTFYFGITLSWISLSFQIALALLLGFTFWKKRNLNSES